MKKFKIEVLLNETTCNLLLDKYLRAKKNVISTGGTFCLSFNTFIALELAKNYEDVVRCGVKYA